MTKNSPDQTGLPKCVILASLYEEPRRVNLCTDSVCVMKPQEPAYMISVWKNHAVVARQIKCASARLEYLCVSSLRLLSKAQEYMGMYFLDSSPTYNFEGQLRPAELGIIAGDLPLVESSMVALTMTNTGPEQLAVSAVLEEYTVAQAWDELQKGPVEVAHSSYVLVKTGGTQKVTLTLLGEELTTRPMYKLKHVLLHTDQDPQGGNLGAVRPRSDLVYVQGVRVHSWDASLRRWPLRPHANKVRSYTEEEFAELSTPRPPPPGVGGQRVFFTEQVLVHDSCDVPVDITVVNHSHEPVYAAVTLFFDMIDVCQQKASAWKAFKSVVQSTTGRTLGV